ncbi:MAG TPA: nuclear transport factor 2 family protein [Gemmatimonadaceae bacterium]
MIVTAVFAASACATQTRSESDIKRSAGGDQQSLVASAQNFLHVFDSLDWERFRASWSKNPTVFFPFVDTPERVDGDAVEERFRMFFSDVRSKRPGPPHLRISPRDLRTEMFGSVGVVTFNLGQRPGDIGRRTLIFVMEDGEWKLAHLHASV